MPVISSKYEGIPQVGPDSDFGSRLLLLSVCEMKGGSIDPYETLGIATLAPAALRTSFEAVARVAQEKGEKKKRRESILGFLRRAIDAFVEHLPKKYVVPAMIIKVLGSLLDAPLDKLRKARAEALKKGEAMMAVASSMLIALREEDAKRSFFESQCLAFSRARPEANQTRPPAQSTGKAKTRARKI